MLKKTFITQNLHCDANDKNHTHTQSTENHMCMHTDLWTVDTYAHAHAHETTFVLC